MAEEKFNYLSSSFHIDPRLLLFSQSNLAADIYEYEIWNKTEKSNLEINWYLANTNDYRQL